MTRDNVLFFGTMFAVLTFVLFYFVIPTVKAVEDHKKELEIMITAEDGSKVPVGFHTGIDSDLLNAVWFLNHASKEDLTWIPDVGPARADSIIVNRPFTSINDLQKIKGIGSGKRFTKMRSWLEGMQDE